MSEWVETTVGELAASTRNALVGGPFGSNLVSKDYVDQGVPVIRGQNMGGRWVAGDFAYVSTEKAGALSANTARPGDIVFTQRGTLGQVALVPNSSFEAYVVSQSQMKLTVDPKKADSLFLYYLFSSPVQQEYIRQNSIQVGVPHTNLGILRDTPVILPKSVDVQQAISRQLGTLDDKIELNRRMNETLEAMARAIFQSWFVDFDPVRAKASGESPDSVCQRLGLTPELLALFPDSFEDSELGEIPAGWNHSTLAAEAKRCGGFVQTGPFGSQLHAADYVEEGMPVVMPQDLINRRISIARIVRVTDEMAQRLSRHALKPGDVIYSRRGDVERHALVGDRESGWLCGTGCLLVRLGAAWPSQAYLSEVLDLPVTREWLVRHAVGATMPNLNTSILGDVPLLIPSEPVMHAFEQVAGPLREQQIASSLLSRKVS
jgi:type I restriction enzyme S subunit